VTIFSKRDDEKRRTSRDDSRKSKRNSLCWMGTWESPRLEPRTMLSLTVTDFPIPMVEIVQPDGITKGSDGNLWFTENATGRIGRMTPAGVFTEFALPAVPPPAGSPAGTAGTTPHPTAITAGPDGALWFAGIPGEIGRITTAGVVTEFAVPAVPPPAGSKPGTASTPAMPTAITAGPDGALWFTGIPGEVGRISTTGVVTEFAVPEIPPPAGSKPGTAGTPATLTAITVGPDGALWFTGVPGEVGRITTAGVVTEFAVPAIPPPAGSSPGTAGTPANLEDITAGPDGALWFTGVPGEVGRITTAGVVSEYATPNFLPANVTTITTGPDGNLWLTGNTDISQLSWLTGNTDIGRITPSGTFTSFNVPGNFNTIAGLTPGPGGNLWFTEQEGGWLKQENGPTMGEQPAVGEITPAGVTKLYALPQETTLNPNLGVRTSPTVITTGPDGALWFGENGVIGRLTTAGTIQQFPLPTPTATVTDITAGPDDAVWFGENGAIGRITTTGAITMHPLSPNSTSAYVTEGRDGNLWFTENLTDPGTGNTTVAIGQITPAGQIQTFALPKKVENDASVGNITVGPDGNLWFPISYGGKSAGTTVGAIGRITAEGNVKMYHVFSSNSNKSYYPPAPPSDIISGPDGKLWFQGTIHGTTGIARISTSGKLGSVIPVGDIASNMARLPNGRVWFQGATDNSDIQELGMATRSSIVVTQDLPESSPNLSPGYSMTVGPDGNLWATSGLLSSAPSIVRISGLDGVSGSLDYRHRPKRAPDYYAGYYDPWTNVSSSAKPTFAGVAKPGAEVTLWVPQGDNQPVSIGQVKASKSDGSWTLTSHLEFSDGAYAVTATQSGDSSPPSVLYSLVPDSSGNLSNALWIQTTPAGKGKAGQRSSHTANTKAVPSGDTSLHHAASRSKRSPSSSPRS